MCDKCQELENKIERLWRTASINDQLTIARLNQLIEETEAEKAALHLEHRNKETTQSRSSTQLEGGMLPVLRLQ